MSQFLRILRKDTRHLWIEICLIVGLTIYSIHGEWLRLEPPFNEHWYTRQLPLLLLIFAWWILAVRAVHLEPLVGHRQFWVTRPYDWKKLLAAKLTLIFSVILLPLLFAEMWLTWKCGYSPLTNVATVLAHVLYMPVLITLPVLVLAALTRKITQWFLCIIGGALCLGLLAGGSSYASRSELGGLSEWPGVLQTLCFYGLAVAALVLQYAHRRTGRSWGIAAIAIASIPVIMFAAPYQRMIRDTFSPANSNDPAPHFKAGTGESTAWGNDEEKFVNLSMPVHVEGVPPGFAIVPVGMRFAVEAEDGSRWEQEWSNNYSLGPVFSGSGDASIALSIDRRFFTHIEKKTARVRVAVAWFEYKYPNPVRVLVDDRFVLPGVGTCWLRDEYRPISCRTLANGSTPFIVELRSNESSCDFKNGDRPPSGLVAHYINTDRESEGFNAVDLRSAYLFSWDFQRAGSPGSRGARPGVCRGTPIWVSRPELTSKHRMEFDLGVVAIPEMKKIGGRGSFALGIGR